MENAELLKIMQGREATSLEAKKLQEKFAEMQEEMEKIKHKMERLKEQTAEHVKDIELEEFEYMVLNIENDVVTVEIHDQIEEMKETLREQKKKQEEAVEAAKKQKEETKDESTTDKS